MAFWSEKYNAESQDPKRGFRFKITFEGMNGADIVWFAKKVGNLHTQSQRLSTLI